MKRNNIILASLLVLSFVLLTACSNQPNAPQISKTSNDMIMSTITEPCGEAQSQTLYAGQTIDAGSVTVTNDAEQVCVEFNTTGDWYILETHLHIASTVDGIPQRNGNPIPGKFANKNSFDVTQMVQNDEFCFDIATLKAELGLAEDQNCFVVAAHASLARVDENGEVVQTETGWSDGNDFSGKNWATYSEYCMQACDDTPEECTGETAWAGSTAGAGNGWWYYFDTAGDATQPIYAGQKETDGSISWNAATDVLTINLGSWNLQDVDEAVKVEGYAEIDFPTQRPPAGQFTLYKGDALTIQGDGSRYYAIHLDVEFCE